MHKPDIDIVIVKKNGQYDVGNGKIERIGGIKGASVSWWIRNNTSNPIHLKIHKFDPDPCPVKHGHFTGCGYDTEARGNKALGAGKDRRVRGTLTGSLGLYTYELYVSDAQTEAGNPVDPELQIDDPGTLASLTPVIATIGLVGGFVLAYWWFTRER